MKKWKNLMNIKIIQKKHKKTFGKNKMMRNQMTLKDLKKVKRKKIEFFINVQIIISFLNFFIFKFNILFQQKLSFNII